MTTKIHAAVDELGRLVAWTITPGQTSDTKVGPKLCKMAAKSQPGAICGDKAYDSNQMRETIKAMGAEAVIPSKKIGWPPSPTTKKNTLCEMPSNGSSAGSKKNAE